MFYHHFCYWSFKFYNNYIYNNIGNCQNHNNQTCIKCSVEVFEKIKTDKSQIILFTKLYFFPLITDFGVKQDSLLFNPS